MIGLAMKLCISSGLHRKSSASSPTLGYELDKRLFWTCYSFDRETTIGTGRPPSISDRDIDVEVRNAGRGISHGVVLLYLVKIYFADTSKSYHWTCPSQAWNWKTCLRRPIATPTFLLTPLPH
jgi:hypothetical protein